MADRQLDIAFWDYDRCRALREGSVAISGAAPRFHTARIVTEIFEGMVAGRYDAAELGMTYLLRTMQDGARPFVALPIFLNRVFRHSAIYVNRSAGIAAPADLNGRRIGELALYSHDAGIAAKGALMDEYGFRPETCRWTVGGIDFPMKPIDFVPQLPPPGLGPPGLDLTLAPPDRDLGVLLQQGALDALISADIPQCVLDGDPAVGPLFPDAEAVERDYYRRTGIFPIMHCVAVTRELAEGEPELVRAIYDAFCAAKEKAQRQLVQGLTFNTMAFMVPWLPALLRADRDLLGADWWPYGIAANRVALDALLRWHGEQGITARRLTAEDVFVPYLLDT